MPEEPNSEPIWDEYAWERFLQEQEKRTEKYMELLEKYLDHPQRDEIIAREMGWRHTEATEEEREWEEEVDAAFEKELGELEKELGIDPNEDADGFSFQQHPLYQSALRWSGELDEIFDNAPAAAQEHPATIALHTASTLAAAKLAAALNDDDSGEIGMNIAYLKRALHALNGSLDATAQLQQAAVLDEESIGKIRARLFELRDGVVATMGDFRAEFRRRQSGL